MADDFLCCFQFLVLMYMCACCTWQKNDKRCVYGSGLYSRRSTMKQGKKRSFNYLIVVAQGRRRAQLVRLLRIVLDDPSLFIGLQPTQTLENLYQSQIFSVLFFLCRFPPPELCNPCCRDILYGSFSTSFSGFQTLPLPPKDQNFRRIFLDF